MGSDRNPDHLYPPFREKFTAALQEFNVWLNVHRPGQFAKMIEGYRSAAYQLQLWNQGRTTPGPIVTYRKGTPGHESDHQQSLAGDVGVFKGSEYIEEPDKETRDYYAHCVRAQGLEAGHDWKHADDPHAQWPESDHATYFAALEWQKKMGLR